MQKLRWMETESQASESEFTEAVPAEVTETEAAETEVTAESTAESTSIPETSASETIEAEAASTEANDLAGFVTRLYQICLDRTRTQMVCRAGLMYCKTIETAVPVLPLALCSARSIRKRTPAMMSM